LRDPIKAQKDKNEPLKVQLLNNEFLRCVQRPEFLSYFGEVSEESIITKLLRLAAILKRLNLNFRIFYNA
jgi:hypothetical protein